MRGISSGGSRDGSLPSACIRSTALKKLANGYARVMRTVPSSSWDSTTSSPGPMPNSAGIRTALLRPLRNVLVEIGMAKGKLIAYTS